MAVTLSLGIAVVLPAGAAADLGAVVLTGLPLPAAVSHGRSAPLIAVEASPLPKVEVTGLPTIELARPPKVEALPRAKLEVPALPEVQPPAQPKVQAPVPPRVQAPAPPAAGSGAPAAPVSPAPVPAAGKAAPSASGAAAGGSGAANVASSTQPRAGTPTGRAVGAGAVPAAPRTRHSQAQRPARTRGRARTTRTAAGPDAAAGAAAAVNGKALGAALGHGAVPHLPRGSGTSRPSSSSSNPLQAIGRHIPFPVPVPDWSKPIILLLLALAGWLATRARVTAARARRLERQRSSLLEDLGVMQATLVPVLPERVGALNVSVAYRPADGPAAGGDFYDVFPLGPSRVAVILGDVAGHGHDALEQAALTRYTLRAYMQAGMEPRAALALAGSVLVDPGEKQFVTVVIAVHDSANGSLTYASAGHPPPIALGFHTPEPLTLCCSAPICCDLPTGRRQTTIALPVGGEVCFFSDGLLEARTDNGLLGRERLAELLEEIGPGRTAAALLERVRAESHSTPDDMVACVISTERATAATAVHVEELEVDAAMLAGAHVGPFLQACGLTAASATPVLARAGVLISRDGAALLRIERQPGGASAAAVLPGLARPAWVAAGERAPEPPLALPAGG